MKLVPITEMTPDLWYYAWNAMFDPALGDVVGTDPALIAAKPPLEDFYRNITKAHEEGRLQAWAIVKDDKFRGYTLLDRTIGEWENGTVLVDPKDWSSGMGVVAAYHAFHWAFDQEGAEWVITFTQGKDPHVRNIHEKIGFRRLMNFWVLDKGTWQERVRPTYERLKKRYLER